ncbi:MAG: mandelate racemase/muconate lactonizing enzyme family protein [Pseudonocardiaceae bacterium]|nr:mandelate racemase/muconate lactonizing enzyme family protein [Pseudonocardiaceae bacterium]
MTPDLRAERVRVTVLSAPLEDTVPMSFASLTDRRLCLVEIDAGGITGIGESWINYPAWAPRERLATLCDGLTPLLVGQDVSDPSRVHNQLTGRLLRLGRQWGAPGPIWQAISAVDLALWDLRGKQVGRSIAELLGTGSLRDRVPAYASGVGPTDAAQLSEAALRAGLTAVKTKIGFGEERDRTTLREARSVLGERPALFADANQAWDLETAKAMAEVLSDYRVDWLEEPLASDELDEFEKLAAVTPIPLATGENLYGVATFDRYVDSAAIHLIQPDLTKSGGFSVGVQVAERARHPPTGVAPHCYGGAVGIAASLQLAAAFPGVRWMELDVRANPLRTDLLTTPLRLESGALVVPEGAGLGIELDRTVTSNYQTHVEERTHHDL